MPSPRLPALRHERAYLPAQLLPARLGRCGRRFGGMFFGGTGHLHGLLLAQHR